MDERDIDLLHEAVDGRGTWLAHLVGEAFADRSKKEER